MPISFDVDHVVLEVEDPARSLGFYVDVLGLAPVRFDEFVRGEAKFPSVRVNGGAVIDLFPRSMWRSSQPANPNHFCLSTSRDEMEELKRRLAARGIPLVRTDDHNFGARGFGRSIYLEDPDGISVEIRHYPGAPG